MIWAVASLSVMELAVEQPPRTTENRVKLQNEIKLWKFFHFVKTARFNVRLFIFFTFSHFNSTPSTRLQR